jgi:hypothetical protein
VLPLVCMGSVLLECGWGGGWVGGASERERGPNLDCSVMNPHRRIDPDFASAV